MAVEIQLRRDTAANWTSANPILGSGEPGYETDTGKIKYGDGTTAWASLAYHGGSTPSDTNPLINGTAAAGTSLLYSRGDHVHPTDTTRAPLASPTFTGTPAAPTASSDTNTTQLATTAYVVGQAASVAPVMNGTAAVGTSLKYARQDHVHASDTSKAGLSSTNTFTGTSSFVGSTSVLSSIFTNAAEVATVSATAATGTINIDVSTQSVLYYTTAASGNFTVNFRLSSTTALNTAMSIGQVITFTFCVNNGATAYYNSAIQVDGTTTGVTTKWQGGTAPTSGDASAVDIYTYAIVKTANATFTVFAAMSKFA